MADEEGYISLINTSMQKQADRSHVFSWMCHRNAIFDVTFSGVPCFSRLAQPFRVIARCLSGARRRRGFSPDSAVRHPKFRILGPKTPFSLCFRAQIFGSPESCSVCRDHARALKTAQRPPKALISEKSADQRSSADSSEIAVFSGVCCIFPRCHKRSANSINFGRLKNLGPETAAKWCPRDGT